MTKTYDVKCADLAREFLADEGLDNKMGVHELALEIQNVIESFIKSALDKQRANSPSKYHQPGKEPT